MTTEAALAEAESRLVILECGVPLRAVMRFHVVRVYADYIRWMENCPFPRLPFDEFRRMRARVVALIGDAETDRLFGTQTQLSDFVLKLSGEELV